MTRHNLISSSISVLLTSLLLLAPGQARAQEEGEARADSIPFFRNVAVSVDALGVGQMLFSDYGQYEAALRVNLKDRWYPVVELGLGVADASDETTLLKYKTSAPYFRVGCDWNLLKNKHDIYRLYGGFRYAFTTFKYDIERESPLEDPVWGRKFGVCLAGQLGQLPLAGSLFRRGRESGRPIPHGVEHTLQAQASSQRGRGGRAMVCPWFWPQ